MLLRCTIPLNYIIRFVTAENILPLNKREQAIVLSKGDTFMSSIEYFFCIQLINFMLIIPLLLLLFPFIQVRAEMIQLTNKLYYQI